METFIQDLRYAVRQLARTPAFTIVAVLTLAVGIGANTALFTMLEAIFVRDVMRTNVIALTPETTVAELSRFVHKHEKISQRLFPVLTSDRKLTGVVTHKQLLEWIPDGREGAIDRWIQKQACTASPLEPLRSVANRMAERGLTRMPVIDADASGAFVGMISLRDLLHARAKNVRDEHHQERVLHLRFLGRTA